MLGGEGQKSMELCSHWYILGETSWQMHDKCLELTLRKTEGTPDVSSQLIMEEEFIQEAVDKLVAVWGK